MNTHKMGAWTLRGAALLVAVAVTPACSLLGEGPSAGTAWLSASTGPVAPGAPNTTNIPLWTDPNLAVPGPIGITHIGGIEVTYGDADPTKFPPGTAEAPHPVSTSRSLDPTGEAVINGAVQQLYKPVVPVNGGQNVANAGPFLQTGDTKLAGISRARAKHEALHPTVGGKLTAPDPGGLAARLGYMKVNPAYTAPRQWEVSGAGLTPAQAATQITGAIGALKLTGNTFGSAGFWTNGSYNFYCFTMITVANGGP